MTLIRMDRMAAPQYRALPPETREGIEAAIPDGCHLTVLSAYFRGHDYHARLFRGSELIAEAKNAYYVADACWAVLRDTSPEPDWEEDEEGFVTAPNLNGAFDKW